MKHRFFNAKTQRRSGVGLGFATANFRPVFWSHGFGWAGFKTFDNQSFKFFFTGKLWRRAKFIVQHLRAAWNTAVPNLSGFCVVASAVGNRAGIDAALGAFNRQLKFIAANSASPFCFSTAEGTRKQFQFRPSCLYDFGFFAYVGHEGVDFLIRLLHEWSMT